MLIIRLFTMLIIMIDQNAAQKLLIIRVGIKLAARYNIAILIIMIKRPNVKMITGRVKSFISGFTSKFTTPKIMPARINSCQSPLKTNPGTSLSAANMAVELAKICMIIRRRKLMGV